MLTLMLLNPVIVAQPNPIYDAPAFASKLRSVPNGVLYSVSAPGEAKMQVLHTFGDAKERGFAHGQLLSAEIAEFITEELDQYYREQVDQIPLGTLPPAIASVVQALMEKAAPAAFNVALGYVFEVNALDTALHDLQAIDGFQARAHPVSSIATGPDAIAAPRAQSQHVFWFPICIVRLVRTPRVIVDGEVYFVLVAELLQQIHRVGRGLGDDCLYAHFLGKFESLHRLRSIGGQPGIEIDHLHTAVYESLPHLFA